MTTFQINTSSVWQQSFTSKFHYAEMAGPRKDFEADLNPSHYALQCSFFINLRFAFLYFISGNVTFRLLGDSSGQWEKYDLTSCLLAKNCGVRIYDL